MRNEFLVTGSSGFIGQYLVASLGTKYPVRAVSLRGYEDGAINFDQVKAVVHLAGLAHKMTEVNPDKYYETNRDLTLRFALEAKEAGVPHFVYISSTKVYGERKNIYNERSECLPDEPYGRSKFEAEEGLKQIETDLFKVAIIRPPLVYGAQVKGNLYRLMNLISKFKIIPLGGIQNQRSMVYIGNLIALIEHIIINEHVGTFLAGDNRLHSTTDLVESISKGLNSKNKIIFLPNLLRKIIGILNPTISKRLFDSLVFDNSETNQKINFTPPYLFEQGIEEMTSHYLSSKSQ